MKKASKLLNPKSAKRRNITNENCFSSFNNSFTIIRKNSSKDYSDFSKQNFQIRKLDKENLVDEEVFIEDFSPPRTSMIVDNSISDSFNIESDNSSEEGIGNDNINIIKKSLDLESVLDTTHCESEKESDIIFAGNKRFIKNGFTERLQTLLRRNKSESAISKYMNKFVNKSEDDYNELDQLFVLRTFVCYNFIQVWTKSLDKNFHIVLLISQNQMKDINSEMILIVTGKRSIANYGDITVWYNIERISVMSQDCQNKLKFDIGHTKNKVISVACDCLLKNSSINFSMCHSSQKNHKFPRYHDYNFERRYNKKCIVVLKKLKFWYNTIIRHCLVFVQYNTDIIGNIYITDGLFGEIFEGNAYLIKDEVRLPDTENIYGSSKQETLEYICYIYQKLCLSSQDKILHFMGKIPRSNSDVNFSSRSISNFDGRLSTINKIENQFIEYLPYWLNVESSPDKSRFNITGIAFFYAVEMFKEKEVLKVFLYTTNLQRNIYEIIIKKLCFYSPLVGFNVCKLYLTDCYTLKGKLIADQFTGVSMKFINTIAFSKTMLKNVILVETFSDIFNAKNGSIARFEGLHIINEQWEKSVYRFCNNCLINMKETAKCENCSSLKNEHLHLYEYDMLMEEGNMNMSVKFISKRELNEIETIMILGYNNKMCLVLDL